MARKLSKALARIDALTLRRIARGTYKARLRSLHDGAGLYIRLRPGGGSWVFRYQIDSALHSMGLGSVAQLGAPEARAMAADFRSALAAGNDPMHERNKERRSQRDEARAGRATFRDIAERVLVAYESSTRNPKTRRSWRQVIEDYAFPVLGAKLIDDIERADILEVLRPIWGSKVDTSRKVRRRIEHIIDEAITMGASSRPNPARWAELKRPLAAFTAEKPPGHHKALPWRQVPSLMKRLQVNHSLSSSALRLAILSACRTGEVLGARYEEFQHGVWTVPATRMKGEVGRRRAHRVPISSGIAAVVKDLEFGKQRSSLLFAGRSPNEPLSNMSMLQLLRGMKVDCTVHGFRSSFRDFAAEHNFPREVAEAALAHVVAGTEGAYLRSDVLEARKALMQAWSDFCLGTAAPAARRKPATPPKS
ncbi:MAG TPA: integrase arm-type DNA-binding domain-containing protein [Reyranella sp.]|nr:integrase arm-type DNA-binding domain-containing protein [Reyranella sp.]